MTAKRNYWFGPKRIGWGISPKSWQGWATIAIYCVLMMASVRVIDPAAHRDLDIAIRVVLTVAFFAILLLKWGKTGKN